MTAISSGEDWLAQDSKIGFAWSCHVTPFRDVFSRTSWKHPGFRRPPYSHLRQATKRDEGSQRREVYLPQVQTGKTSWISSCSTAATYSKMKSLSWKNVAAEKCCLCFLVLSYFTKSWQEISSTGRGIHVFQFTDDAFSWGETFTPYAAKHLIESTKCIYHFLNSTIPSTAVII